MARFFLGIDVGTQGAKAVLYETEAQRIVSSATKAYDLLATDVPGRAEQKPSTWIEGLREAVVAALAGTDGSKVGGIAVSGQQHGMVLLDETGSVVRDAKLWCDVEAAAEAAYISESSGFCYPPGFTAPKVLWVKNNEPEVFQLVSHVLLPNSFVNHYLTGRYCIECGDASGTAVMDVARRCWDPLAAARVDDRLMEWLPEIIAPEEVVGTLRPEVAAELGLSSSTIVAPGGGDNMMSALGAAAVREGVWVVSLGTSATLFGHSAHPILDPSGTVAPFCDCTGAWMPLLCIMNCTAVAEDARASSGLSHQQITDLAVAVPPGCHGVNFLPYLTGERTPNWPHATGALLGLRPGHLPNHALIYRAVLEGVAFTLMAGMNKLKGLGCKVEELRVVGGGSKNPLWCQIIADVFQVPVKLPVEGAESAALGAALQAAAVASGERVADYVLKHEPRMRDQVIVPNEGSAEAYSCAFNRHMELGEKLFA